MTVKPPVKPSCVSDIILLALSNGLVKLFKKEDEIHWHILSSTFFCGDNKVSILNAGQ